MDGEHKWLQAVLLILIWMHIMESQ